MAITGGNASTGKPTFSWTPVEGAAKYEVWRSTGGAYGRISTPTSTKVTHLAAVAGTTYYYKVRALDAKGNVISEYSNVLKITCK